MRSTSRVEFGKRLQAMNNRFWTFVRFYFVGETAAIRNVMFALVMKMSEEGVWNGS